MISIQIENQTRNIFKNVYNLIKNKNKKKKYVFSMCFAARCLRVFALPRRQIRLTDGCGFWGNTYTHTGTHLHTHTRAHSKRNPHLGSPRALDMPAALGLTYDATWEICLCFPLPPLLSFHPSPHSSCCCFAFICLFVCRVCLLISQLGVRLSDSPRMVNRRNSPPAHAFIAS